MIDPTTTESTTTTATEATTSEPKDVGEVEATTIDRQAEIYEPVAGQAREQSKP
jgi:hypothetical protein